MFFCFPLRYNLYIELLAYHLVFCHELTFSRATACYSAYTPRQFRPSVRLSVTHVLCIKTAERVIEILSLSDRPIILVFRHQGSLRKSDSFTQRGRRIQGVAIFDQYAAISRKR